MVHPQFREALRGPGPVLGLFCMEVCTPGIALLAREAGADFVVLDMEHSGFGFESIKAACMGARAGAVPALVRIAHKHAQEVSRALDVGASGIMAPLVGSAAEAAAITGWATYPPGGSRGAALAIAHDGYRAGPTPAKLAAANAGRAIVTQIETGEGAAAADAIAALPEVDCLWIGHSDLSISLGIPGQYDHPSFAAAEGQVRDAAKRHGKGFGRLASGPEEAKALLGRGYTVLGLSSDIAAIQARIREGVALLRGGA